MAESLVAIVLDRLLSITGQQAAHSLKLVTGINEEVESLTSNLHAIKAVLKDAEKRQVNDFAVKHCDDEVESHFEKSIWVYVSDPFEEERIAVEILKCFLGRKPDLVGKHHIMQKISDLVYGKKILLVLDDVWTDDPRKWE
ncbi:hypothetical protein DITRI_Ditri15bG0078300 [Diplodiscus trichospermus]